MKLYHTIPKKCKCGVLICKSHSTISFAHGQYARRKRSAARLRGGGKKACRDTPRREAQRRGYRRYAMGNPWGHSPQNKPEMEVRIHCGKFSRKNNRIEYQSFLPFVKYSKIPCGECPHFSQGVVAVECGNATNLRESIGEGSRSACSRGRTRGVQAPRIGSARQPRRTSPCRKALRRRHPGFALPRRPRRR